MEGSIGKDIVYREMYNEMRRYRDYELNSSKWYTPMLLAILGFVLQDRMFVSTPSTAATPTFSPSFIGLILPITVLLVVASVNGVQYASKRYNELREFMKGHEPEGSFKPLPRSPMPRYFINGTQIGIGIAIFIAVLCIK